MPCLLGKLTSQLQLAKAKKTDEVPWMLKGGKGELKPSAIFPSENQNQKQTKKPLGHSFIIHPVRATASLKYCAHKWR